MRFVLLLVLLYPTYARAQGSFGVNLLPPVTPPTVNTGENAYCPQPNDASCFQGNMTDGPAKLPTHGMYTGMDGTPAPGSTIEITSDTALTSALASMTCGQHLRIHVAFGPYHAFTLPAKNCDAQHWIWIESDQRTAAGFPAEGQMATPCFSNQAQVMFYPHYPCANPLQLLAQFTCTGTSSCISNAGTGSNYYRLIGLDIWCNPSGTNNVTGTCVNFSGGMDHIILDRSLVHGQPISCTPGSDGLMACTSRDVDNGITTAGSGHIAFISGWIYDILNPQGSTTETHGFGFGGSSQVDGREDVKKLWNVLLASAGEAWFSGGSGNQQQIQIYPPRDLELRRVYTFKPVSWLLCTNGSGTVGCHGAQHPVIKNNGEFKNADRVLVEGLVCENSWSGWQSDQGGYCLLLTPKNQSVQVNVSSTSNAAGTTLTGAFPQTVISNFCAVVSSCKITFNGVVTHAQTWTSTAVTVSPAVTPSTTDTTTTVCLPGLNPWAQTTNLTYRFVDIRNSKNGFTLGAGTSDCGDSDWGVNAVSLHNIQFQGINARLGNKLPGQIGGAQQCFFLYNGNSYLYPLHNFVIEHNTCAQAQDFAASNSGVDFTLDAADATGNGSGQIIQRVQRNNIGPMGALAGYHLGGLHTGGMNHGIVMQSGTSWTYTRNVLGVGLWPNQNTQGLPLPASNADPGDSPAGTGCNASGATCRPSGTAFTNLFMAYDGPQGQPGYLGNYQLRAGSPYANAATDGGPIGVDYTNWNVMLGGLWYASTLPNTAASITTTSLPAATHGVSYTHNLSGVSASPMQQWWVISGNLPAGISLTVCGPSWCLTGTPSTTGSYPVQFEMMDAAQRYATSGTMTLVVN